MLPTPSPRKVFRAHSLRARILAPQHPERAAGAGSQDPGRRGRARRDPGGSSPSASPQGSRPGAPRFPQTPTWRLPPPPAPPPLRPRLGPREPPPAKFRFPPLRGPAPPPGAPRPPRHLPGPARAGGGAQAATLPGRRLRPQPRRRSGGPARPARSGRDGRGRSLARSLAGDFTAPPVPADNGRPGRLTSCARISAPSLKRPARARAHPPCPFFPVPSPRPPPWPAPPFPPPHAAGSRGGALGRGHTR